VDGGGHHPEKVFQIPVRQKRLSDEIKTQVIDRYKAGETVLSIASTFKIHRSTVFIILKKAGVSRRK
jgi:DNA invertase Pin-like site-specific DNA recombinase